MTDNRFDNPQTYRRPRWYFLFPLLFAGVALLMGAVVMWLWNAILPEVLGVGALSFWQAVGLLALCRILFGGFRGGNWRPQRHKFRRERWMQMSEEERARFREEWRNRCRTRSNAPDND